jgi:hypothetical protein
VTILHMIEIEKKIVCGDGQAVWQEGIFHLWTDEEQRKKFIALWSLQDYAKT